MFDGRLSITAVAKQLGISAKTITRWERAGKIRPAKRDWRGWRVYSHEEMEEMRDLVTALY